MEDKIGNLDEEALEQILSRCTAAGPKPWKSFVEGRDHHCGSDFIMVGEDNERGDDIELTGATVAAQDFIANARQDIPKLILEIRRLRAIINSAG